MIVVRKRRGGGGRTRVSTVSAAELSSGPSLALRFMSNSTSSLPLAGRCAYSEVMIARVLTVKSITDWKVRIGGRPASRSPRASRRICSCSACVSCQDWRAPLTGNELYLNGIELGQDAEPGGLGEGRQDRRQAGEAREARERRDADHRRDQHQAVGPRQRRVLDRVERILHGERAAVREADEVQRQRRADPRGAPRARRAASRPSSPPTRPR